MAFSFSFSTYEFDIYFTTFVLLSQNKQKAGEPSESPPAIKKLYYSETAVSLAGFNRELLQMPDILYIFLDGTV